MLSHMPSPRLIIDMSGNRLGSVHLACGNEAGVVICDHSDICATPRDHAGNRIGQRGAKVRLAPRLELILHNGCDQHPYGQGVGDDRKNHVSIRQHPFLHGAGEYPFCASRQGRWAVSSHVAPLVGFSGRHCLYIAYSVAGIYLHPRRPRVVLLQGKVGRERRSTDRSLLVA